MDMQEESECHITQLQQCWP